MRLIAQKPCSFDGKKFLIGDVIPSELVANPKAQEKMGVIAIANDGSELPEMQDIVSQVGVVKFDVAIHADEGDLILQVTNEELSVFTDILQIPVSKTEDKQKISEMIQNIESEDLLIILDALDGRKHVSEEAQKRAQELHANDEEESEGEPQTGGDE